MLTLSCCWMAATMLTATCWWGKLMLIVTTRTNWMINNVMPDSIIMNKTFRSLLPPLVFEFNEPKVSSPETALTSKNTLRILYTIKPVTRAFTAMDAAKLVAITGGPQRASWNPALSSNIVAASDPNQVARDDKIEIGLSKEDRPTDLRIRLQGIMVG